MATSDAWGKEARHSVEIPEEVLKVVAELEQPQLDWMLGLYATNQYAFTEHAAVEIPEGAWLLAISNQFKESE